MSEDLISLGVRNIDVIVINNDLRIVSERTECPTAEVSGPDVYRIRSI